MVYGNIYEMPADIGEFDITVVGAILPWRPRRKRANPQAETILG